MTKWYEQPNFESRTCSVCGGNIPPCSKLSDYNRRIYCSNSCKGAAFRIPERPAHEFEHALRDDAEIVLMNRMLDAGQTMTDDEWESWLTRQIGTVDRPNTTACRRIVSNR